MPTVIEDKLTRLMGKVNNFTEIVWYRFAIVLRLAKLWEHTASFWPAAHCINAIRNFVVLQTSIFRLFDNSTAGLWTPNIHCLCVFLSFCCCLDQLILLALHLASSLFLSLLMPFSLHRIVRCALTCSRLQMELFAMTFNSFQRGAVIHKIFVFQKLQCAERF